VRRWLRFSFSCCFLSAAELPKIAVVGGPNLLWPQIVSEYERRYPSQPATWEIGVTAKSTDVVDTGFQVRNGIVS
jgi:hypothetical protein